MLKFLTIIINLIIRTHSWTWEDYPSPRGESRWKCGVTNPAYVCDPDGMLTDQQRKQIVELVEDFKEKTKKPNSKFLCMNEGLRLVVALSKNKIDRQRYTPSGYTELCTNDRRWTASDRIECESRVHGIELNTDSFQNCAQIYFFWRLYDIDYEKLNREERPLLYNNNTFDALKNYIIKLRKLYIDRFSILYNHDNSYEDNITLSKGFFTIFSNNLLGIISIIFCLIIGSVLLFFICQIRQIKNYLKQRNASKIETQLMTPIQPVEIVEKRRENEETITPFLNI